MAKTTYFVSYRGPGFHTDSTVFACSCLIKARVAIAVNVDNSKRLRSDNDFLKAKRSAATCYFR